MISIEMSRDILVKLDKLILKLMWKIKMPRKLKTVLKKKKLEGYYHYVGWYWWRK